MSLSTSPSITTRPRDVQITSIATNTKIFRSRTWDRLKFEVEYARQKGTTANSYLIQADKIALIDPPGESFKDIFIAQLQQHLDLSQLDYIILSHVNANRMATLKAIIAKAPHVTLICSKPGANTLKLSFPQWETQIQIVREDILDLGQGHRLEFVTVPTPRWADGLCTYDPATRILYTDKFFGVHVCNDAVWDEDWKQLDDDRRYYFDCLHAPQKKQVETALDKLTTFPAKYYAPSHGTLIRYSLSRLTYDYSQWCQEQQTQTLSVALLYASAYGSTDVLAKAIAEGLFDSDVAIELINCEIAKPEEIAQAIEACDGFIIGSPTLGGHAPVQIQTALGIVLNAAAKTKLAGVFGSYGWSGEAIDVIEGKLRDGNYSLGFESIRVRFTPTEADLETAKAAGIEFARVLKKTQKLRVPRQGLAVASSDRTEQAVGRIIGSLCVLTLKQNQNHSEIHSGFLTSGISQASFSPPGIMLSLAEEQNAGFLWQPGTSFVLNILKEGRNLRRYFTSRYTPGDNPFSQLATQTANNGCMILTEALAYLECTVESRIQSGDRWLIYALVNQGQVLEATGVTAIEHRKSALSS
jgi:flavorubredoxin/flavin reductase (DIM6/NTAB) family NADH-FMN oxidoreductase RutF